MPVVVDVTRPEKPSAAIVDKTDLPILKIYDTAVDAILDTDQSNKVRAIIHHAINAGGDKNFFRVASSDDEINEEFHFDDPGTQDSALLKAEALAYAAARDGVATTIDIYVGIESVYYTFDVIEAG